ncbi:MAG: hypothetical protein M0R02_04495 [Bacteroidales bacterium]|nr:hypothetical protein [Bacteroidales bacterium]NLK81071.1 dinitrogenase iron-molybdenum cofactor biosynthesis protein [Bacteroidales bacterium]HPY82775.1 NifB/NifX family molybdenum-iron cluster-binding protein [Bacteroidales bacterium]
MKVAITSVGNTVDSSVDSRFGRCSFFALYDTESGNVEFVENNEKNAIEGAGPAAAQFVASFGVQKVISGEFGQKVKAIFDQLKIQLIVIQDEKTVADIIKML